MRFFRAIAPCNFGLLTIHIWIYCTTHRPGRFDDVSFMAVMYLALSAFLVILVLSTRTNPLSDQFKKRMDVTAAVFMAAFALLLALPFASAVPSIVVGSALGGVGVGWAYMRWGEFYTKLDIHYAAPLIFLTMALGSIGKTLVDFLPAIPATAILVCLPVVTFVTLRQSLTAVPETPEPYRYYNARTIGSLWRVVLGIAVYSFTVGIIQSIYLEAMPSPYYLSVLAHHAGEVVISLALFLWVVSFKRGLSFSRTWRIVLLLMATALIFTPYLEEVFGSYLFALVRIAQTFLIVFLFLALADVARHSTYRAITVFAAGWVAYSLPFALGKIVGPALQTFGQGAPMVMAVIVWVLVIVTMFCLDESSAGNHLIFTELNDGGEEDTPAKRMGVMQQALNEQETADTLSARCKTVAAEYRLTPREHEILELLARGRSKAYIADAFFISENTVRGHAKRLYAKLEVHSKQELVDLVESAEI